MLEKIKILLLLFITTFTYSQQKIEYYNYGYDGMEYVSRIGDSMIVYSNYKSRPLIRAEVCDFILKNYKKLKNGPYIVDIRNIKVTGRLEIDRKNNFVSVKYYYEKVNYGDTLVEIYKKPVVKPIKKVKKRVKKK